jgi:hypothetical protein
LHDLGVQAHRGVVDEHPAAGQTQVDAPLHRRPERIEGTDHVVAVQPEVHGQMVAGARGDADECHSVIGGHAGHQRLRAVSTGHADHVGTAGDGLLGQSTQVVARCQHDRLDASPLRLLDEVESLHLAAPRPRVHQQHRPRRRRDRRPGCRAAPE